MPESTEVRRFDRIQLGTIKRLDDGTITSTAVITRAGIFKYRRADGSIQLELRPPEEVFHADSMASARMLPITNDHPKSVFIEPATAKELSIGFTGENVAREDNNLAVPVKINTEEGIGAVDAGRRQFSCGYSAEVFKEDGLWEGERYDAIQRNIRYNHLALVDQGRAGEVASLRLDGADAFQVEETSAPSNEADPKGPKGRNTMPAKVKLDNGLSYDCADEVAVEFQQKCDALASANAKLEAAEKATVEMKSDRDKLQGKVEELESQVKDFDKKLDEAVKAGVEARSKILDQAKKIITKDDEQKKLDGMTVAEIREAAILAARPDAKLDGYSEDRLDGMFEAIVDAGPTSKQQQNGRTLGGDGTRREDAKDKDPEEARLDGMKRLEESSRAPIGQTE